MKERRQVAVVKVASNANNGDGASDSNRSFIERDEQVRSCAAKPKANVGFIGC